MKEPKKRGKGALYLSIQEKKCRKCGKNFVPAAEHIYKDGSAYFCGWTCFLHRKDKEEP